MRRLDEGEHIGKRCIQCRGWLPHRSYETDAGLMCWGCVYALDNKQPKFFFSPSLEDLEKLCPDCMKVLGLHWKDRGFGRTELAAEDPIERKLSKEQE